MVCGDDHQGVADVMPGAESVTTELSDAVLTMPVTGKVSMASGEMTLPCA